MMDWLRKMLGLLPFREGSTEQPNGNHNGKRAANEALEAARDRQARKEELKREMEMRMRIVAAQAEAKLGGRR